MRTRTAEGSVRTRARALLLAGLAVAASPAGAAQAAPRVRPDWPQATVELRTHSGVRRFTVDVADTPAREELGLMRVRILPEGYGMLFPVVPVRVMRMWMKDTYLSLDMIFIDEQGRVACVRENTTPLSEAIVECPRPSTAVLEIAGGEARRLGVRPGDRVAYPAPQA